MKPGKLTATFFAAVIAMGIAASAGAVDGTIEINQAKVMANGGFPYVISASGSYRLSGGLTVPASTDGINVTAANVAIDLNGFSVAGPGTLNGEIEGINASGVGGVRVENGTVTGFGTGLFAGSFGIVRNVQANTNGFGIEAGNNTVVEACTANNNSGAGIQCSVQGCVISGNTANSNSFQGIDCGSGCQISGNTANSNATGVECSGTGCLINGNTIDNNSGPAIKAGDPTTAYGWNVLDGDGGGISGGTSMAGKNTNSCGGPAC
jgi:parallel beta-helix repeat protein